MSAKKKVVFFYLCFKVTETMRNSKNSSIYNIVFYIYAAKHTYKHT